MILIDLSSGNIVTHIEVFTISSHFKDICLIFAFPLSHLCLCSLLSHLISKFMTLTQNIHRKQFLKICLKSRQHFEMLKKKGKGGEALPCDSLGFWL